MLEKKTVMAIDFCNFVGITANTVFVNRRLAGSIQDTRVYRSAVIDVKSKDHHLVVSKVNLKLKFRKGNYLPES